MTGIEMVGNLGLRTEDPAESVFTLSAKLDALNLAQKGVINMLDNAYLSELETIASNKTATTGDIYSTCAYSEAFGVTVQAQPIRNGIRAVYDNTNTKWCTMIEPGDIKRLENSYLKGTVANPVAFIFDETVYIQPKTCVSVDIWYLIAGTEVLNTTAECVLNPALHELVLDFAEAQLWRMDAKGERATLAYTSALNMIKTLNERYQVERPEGIGTKGR